MQKTPDEIRHRLLVLKQHYDNACSEIEKNKESGLDLSPLVNFKDEAMSRMKELAWAGGYKNVEEATDFKTMFGHKYAELEGGNRFMSFNCGLNVAF